MKLIGMFSPNGRMNWKRFIRVNLLLITWLIFFVPVWFGISCWTGFLGLFDKPNLLYWILVLVSWFLFSGAPFIIVSHIRRWHDLNKSGWNALASVPMTFTFPITILGTWILFSYGFWFGIFGVITILMPAVVVGYMCFAKGTNGENKYGTPNV